MFKGAICFHKSCPSKIVCTLKVAKQSPSLGKQNFMMKTFAVKNSARKISLLALDKLNATWFKSTAVSHDHTPKPGLRWHTLFICIHSMTSRCYQVSCSISDLVQVMKPFFSVMPIWMSYFFVFSDEAKINHTWQSGFSIKRFNLKSKLRVYNLNTTNFIKRFIALF